MASPFLTAFGTEDRICPYAATPRHSQTTTKAPTPARNDLSSFHYAREAGPFVEEAPSLRRPNLIDQPRKALRHSECRFCHPVRATTECKPHRAPPAKTASTAVFHPDSEHRPAISTVDVEHPLRVDGGRVDAPLITVGMILVDRRVFSPISASRSALVCVMS